MAYFKKLGIFIHAYPAEIASARFAAPLSEQEAEGLSLAFMKDLSNRLSRLKKTDAMIFYPGDEPGFAGGDVPERFSLVRQEGASFGERLRNAFRLLLSEPENYGVMIGTGSPDVPLSYVRRAFLKLKHKDVVLGPGSDGGYYLIGAKPPAPPLFDTMCWGERSVFERALQTIEMRGLSLSLLPVWYAVRDLEGLSLLCAMMHARILEKSGRFPWTERELKKIFDAKGTKGR